MSKYIPPSQRQPQTEPVKNTFANFPKLTKSQKNYNPSANNVESCYLSAINHETKPHPLLHLIPKDPLAKPGWVVISKRPNKPIKYESYKPKDGDNPEDDTDTDTDTANFVQYLNNATTNYLQYKAQYIENWGLDEYNETYIFPNYDYEYFDKLDKAYEILEQEKKMEDEYDEMGYDDNGDISDLNRHDKWMCA